MGAFILKRLFQAFIAVFGVLTFVFFLQRLTGDPVALLAPVNTTAEDLERIRHSLGLDRPLIVQYLDFLWGVVRLDLGRSLAQSIPVSDLIWSRLPYTLWLAVSSLVFALVLGVPLGVIMAVWRRHKLMAIPSTIVLAGQSLPTFWSGIMFILIFAVGLGWLPSSGARTPNSVILPMVALGLFSMATFARVMRTAMIDELSKDYIRTARAKGVPKNAMIARHLMRNSLIPLITMLALELANLLAGAAVVETVFAWPGLGQLAVQSIGARDFPVVQGVVLLGAVTAISLNFLADVLYGAVDPRIRVGRGG
ncbi:ABC transporter permease [Acuticoccus mangrovi]|uniref:ABC transporter permease n=1 Tax=Acuticoccus mangrovi TaxID=2796142 RepID=A0A934IKT2_9HYPH|nr:ABC transporter permease [Acuticoccus mangrovi]MBJ3776806.1 ABC transporter permease [Acuticoccus mangrovi]